MTTYLDLVQLQVSVAGSQRAMCLAQSHMPGEQLRDKRKKLDMDLVNSHCQASQYSILNISVSHRSPQPCEAGDTHG